MQKLRKSVIDSVFDSRCSGAEIQFLLHISQFQSNLGVVRHVRCKDIRFAISISKQTFYNILSSLTEKQIIEVFKESHGEYTVKILNNAFQEYKDFGKDKGYIKTQYDFLHELSFRRLKLNAKRLSLKMMRVLYKLDDSETYFSIRYENMLNWIGIKSRRILLGYLMSLEKYFVISYNKNTCAFKLRRPAPDHDRVSNTEMYKYLNYRFIHICRKFKISYTGKDLKDFLLLFRQYPTKHKQLYFAFISTALSLKSIQPALIHSVACKAA